MRDSVSVRKSPRDRTLHQFLVLSSLFIGVNVVLMEIALFVMSLNSDLGVVVMWSFLIPISIYTVRVLKYFWAMSTGRILPNMGVSSFAGGVVGLLFLWGCAAIFDIRVVSF